MSDERSIAQRAADAYYERKKKLDDAQSKLNDAALNFRQDHSNSCHCGSCDLHRAAIGFRRVIEDQHAEEVKIWRVVGGEHPTRRKERLRREHAGHATEVLDD